MYLELFDIKYQSRIVSKGNIDMLQIQAWEKSMSNLAYCDLIEFSPHSSRIWGFSVT